MKEFLQTELFKIGDQGSVTLSSLLYILISGFIIWFAYKWIKKLAKSAVKSGRLDSGREFAITRITKYVLTLVFIIIALVAFHVNWTGFLALTPLLLGVGLGLQQVANDLVSGFILLVEPTIRVNDIVEVDGVVARVTLIGLRTSKVTTRDGISMIIPNHQLVSEKLINWSTSDTITRFKIDVGVAYGSNVELVKKILEECAWKHSKVITNPAPIVFFKDFGDSSLDFELVFWSNQLFPIDHIMSDLRYQIEESFRANNVTIPFPQRDLHIKREDSLL